MEAKEKREKKKKISHAGDAEARRKQDG